MFQKKTFQEEVFLLKATAHQRRVCRADKTSRTTLDYEYLNQMEYDGRYFSWVDCHETVVDTKGNVLSKKRFTFITNIPHSPTNLDNETTYGVKTVAGKHHSRTWGDQQDKKKGVNEIKQIEALIGWSLLLIKCHCFGVNRPPKKSDP